MHDNPTTADHFARCDIGMNPLFSDRAEEVVHHDEAMMADDKKKEKPDRVYGLRETKAFEKALSSPMRDQTTLSVKNAITSSPFQKHWRPFAFSFLDPRGQV